MSPNLPVAVLDHGPNFLHRKLTSLGFTNLIKVKDGETREIGPFKVTLYAPFVKHPFDASELGNFLDSALVIEANGKAVLNANDNTPDVAAAKRLYERHGRFEVAQLKDSLAGAYPSCFLNLSNNEKLLEARKLVIRQLSAMCEVAKELKAELFQPFAGDYQLGGNLIDKNKFLGVAGKKFSAEFIAARGLRPLILNEQGSIDLITGELKATYRKEIEPYEKWTERVRKIPYDWENEKIPHEEELWSLCFDARQKLYQKQSQLNFFPSYSVSIRSGQLNFSFRFEGTTVDNEPNPDLICQLDPRLLYRILTRRSHWNNAEVGCHIDFIRRGSYNPDVHAMMSFFHG
jgi:UDP-MurNAc hydroxylase